MAAGPGDAHLTGTTDELKRQLATALAERDEARAQQAAMAEVLQLINSSPDDLKPVFDTLVDKAVAMSGAAGGELVVFEGDTATAVSLRNVRPALVEFWKTPQPILATSVGRSKARRETIHHADMAEVQGYKDRRPLTVAGVELGGIRSYLQVPLVGQNGTLGMFMVFRHEVRLFSDRQVALVEAFAEQAVIALENARMVRETREALAQQTATTEVLEVINSSPGDLGPVFDAMLEKAMHLCEAAFGIFGRFDGRVFEPIVDRGVPAALIATTRQIQSPPPNSGLGRLAAGEEVVQLVDLANTDVYRAGFVGATALVDIGGAKTAIFVALRKDGVLRGVIVMYRREVRRFSDRQIALLQNFAAQAVIAMENARLLIEQRESLEQQTATADILRVISQSPTDVQPVLDVVVKAAQRFCGAEDVVISLRDGNELLIAAHEGPLGVPSARRKLDRSSSQGRAVIDARTVHTADFTQLDPAEWSKALELSRTFGFNSAVAAPMLRDGAAIGAIFLRRPGTGPFTPRQIELCESFAAQAVIAIENVRLFTELRESLDQQTATADILRVISQSPTDVQPVLDAVAESARRFCGSDNVHIHMKDGDELVTRATASAPAATGYLGALIGTRIPLDRRSAAGRAILESRTVHLPNVMSLDPAEYGKSQELARVGGVNTVLCAPMIRDGGAIGVITLPKTSAEPFTARQIALLEAFAAQAVIAIENVRLFTELRESLDQQTATAEVLETINRSQGNLQPVFDTIVTKAMALCDAAFGMFNTFDGERYHTAATVNIPEAYARFRATNPPDYGPTTAPGRLIAGEDIIQNVDMADSDLYRNGDPNRRSIVELGGARTILNLALRREGKLLGMIAIYRQEVKPFTDQQIALVQGFATQAVIAMENARLLSELRESLEQQTATAEILRVISQSPTDVQPVLSAVAKAALRFCGAEDVVITLREGDQWLIAGHDGSMPASVGTRQPLTRETSPGRAMVDSRTIHYPDIPSLDPVEYAAAHDFSRRQGFKAALAAPMLREGVAIGAVALRKSGVGAFTPRQIELLESFAAQAVIAIENVRLFTELRQRTDDLTESLEYQTATSEVLGVISRSPADMQPVLEAMTAAAIRLCGAKTGGLSVRRGNTLEFVALVGQTPEFERWQLGAPLPIERSVLIGQAVLDRQPMQIVDVMETDAYKAGAEVERAVVDLGGHRTILHVPLMRDGEAVGVLTVSRSVPEAFTDRQIGLIKTFADQAVIAMENARLLSELRESLDQQTATAEILGVINSSPGNLAPVFQTILEKAHSSCGADMGSLFTWDGTHVRAVATLGYDAEVDGILREPHALIPAMVDLMSGERVFHRVYEQERASDVPHPFGPRFLAASRIRTNLIVPLRKDDAVLGFISANRHEVRPYSDKEIALLENFAAQAVIAMENARLLTELRERTDDLTESLEYQTATSDVLTAISRSTLDLAPVLQTLSETALRLCQAEMGFISQREGDIYRVVTAAGATPESARDAREYQQYQQAFPLAPNRGSLTGRVALEGRPVQIADITVDPEYELAGATALGKIMTQVGVPLIREGAMVGVIVLSRQRVEPFSDRQIGLLRTFADQAVIAMENARLLGELTRREEELRVTFDHMGDGVAMFDAELKLASWNRNFQELLDIPDSFLSTRPGLDDYVRLLARRGELGDGNADEEVGRYRERAGTQWSLERTRPDGRILEVRNNPVPGGGAVLIYSDITERKKAEAEIAAARDAAEAALERQTATADILKVIASSPTDVQPVLDEVAKAAVQFCRATDAVIHMRDGNEARLAAHEGPLGTVAGRRSPLNRETGYGGAILDCRTIHHSDVGVLDPVEFAATLRLAAETGFRAALCVPLLREGAAIGAISLRRIDPGPFTLQQVTLLETFAAQAVIAIENVRLFTELRDSLERLKAAQANLVQSEKMATLGQLTAGIAHEIKNPLNFINNFADLSVELLGELRESAAPAFAALDDDTRADIDETAAMLTSNLKKITEHGKRADGIVKSMLSHSRGGAGDWQKSDINALVEEALNLAYHGARAQDKEFNVTLERDFEEASKPIDVVPQDVTRVFLNLFGNGFYAANKRRLAGSDPGYRPMIRVSTRDTGEGVEVKVRDNGTGIPPEVRDKLFQAFFTTKPTGEGTGLGLSISYDIVAQQHGGTIEVASEPGSFTEFTVRLPRNRRATSSERV